MSFSLSRTESGDIVLTNTSPFEVDVHGFSLRGASTLEFPKLSLIKPNGTLLIPGDKIGGASPYVSLYDSKQRLLATESISQASTFALRPTTQVSAVYTAVEKDPVPSEEKTISNAQPAAEESIIQIGSTPTPPKDNLLTRIFKKISGFFRL